MTTTSPAPVITRGYCVVLVDLTTSVTPTAMRPAASFPAMIAAWEEQIQGPFGQSYGAPAVTFRIASGPDDRGAGEVAMNFRDTIPEAPGALAYHQVTNGVPDIELGVDLFTSLTSGEESLSSGGSHELLEMLGDLGANEWADREDSSGEMDARESCDFVQNTGYAASNGVWVSNFVLPNFFIPGSSGPWDQMAVMTSQYDVSNGYGIQAPSPSTTSQIGGMSAAAERHHPVRIVGTLSDRQRKRKSHPYSRTYRRGVRLGAEAPKAQGE